MDIERGMEKLQEVLKKYGADDLAESLTSQSEINKLLGPDDGMESLSDLLLANTKNLSEEEIREINNNLQDLMGSIHKKGNKLEGS